jgi:hypothetical protein
VGSSSIFNRSGTLRSGAIIMGMCHAASLEIVLALTS